LGRQSERHGVPTAGKQNEESTRELGPVDLNSTALNVPQFIVHVAPEAADRIRRGGGRLFVWTRQVGRGGTRDFHSFGPPPSDIAFGCRHDSKRDVEICIAADLTPREVIV
jgi:hypothetical protein